MFNSLTANRSLAFRMVAVQAAVATLVALGFLMLDARAALAAAISGYAVALGSLLLAWRSMIGPAYSAGLALARMVSGLVLKWFVVLGLLYIAMAKLALPPLPLVVGLALTAMTSLFTLNSKA